MATNHHYLNDARAFIAAVPWTFAKTMPWIPHEYTRRGQSPTEDFEAMVERIRAHGYREEWRSGRVFVYLDVDGWKYWTMGNPLPETSIINRALIEGQHPKFRERRQGEYPGSWRKKKAGNAAQMTLDIAAAMGAIA